MPLTRRQFVHRSLLIGTGAVVGAASVRVVQAHADARGVVDAGATGRVAVDTASATTLDIGYAPVNVTGRRRMAVAVNGSVPGPVLRWQEGQPVTIRVRNHLPDAATSIHWHGVLVPADMDGVPGLSFPGIPPGGTFDYRFTPRQRGTYWYHAHSGYQEQQGLYGAVVIEPAAPSPAPYDREHVILLSDWSDESPTRIAARLRQAPGYYNHRQRTHGTLLRDIRARGLRSTLSERAMWARMRMSASDLADVTGETYTFTVNGRPPSRPWTGAWATGEVLRLRLINGSSMTYFDVRIPGLPLRVIAADGQEVRPVDVEELRVAPGETFDVLVTPGAAPAYCLFAQTMDRSGAAVGALTRDPDARPEVPALDPRPILGMADMAMSTEEMKDMAGMDMPDMEMPRPVHHPRSERHSVYVDMQAEMPMSRLADPGVGLRDDGRRALVYADLVSLRPLEAPTPTRTIELHLTGNMERYLWAFDGVPYHEATPIRLALGERVRFVLVNDTMMAHPIHLHGLWSDLEDAREQVVARKHTIDMPPGSRRSFCVTADAPGRWALHCHLLYHMHGGMFREVWVGESPDGPAVATHEAHR